MAIIKSGEYNPTHKQLVQRIAHWYKMRRQSCVIMAEFVTAAQEIPDIIIWGSGAHSTLIECKVSRSDFLSDKSKFFRRQEDYGMGEHRYYAAPKGIISLDELPYGWGFLEVDNKFVRKLVEPIQKESNKNKECLMLISALRRLEISTAVYVREERIE